MQQMGVLMVYVFPKVAELLESKELVGVVRGCIKSMQTPSESLLKIGCILGLRVSPSHRYLINATI